MSLAKSYKYRIALNIMSPNKRRLGRLAKIVVSKDLYKKLKSINNHDDYKNVTIYSIISSLEKEYHQIYNLILIFEKENKNVFIPKNKLFLVPSKLMFLKHKFTVEEALKLHDYLDNIKKDLKCSN